MSSPGRLASTEAACACLTVSADRAQHLWARLLRVQHALAVAGPACNAAVRHSLTRADPPRPIMCPRPERGRCVAPPHHQLAGRHALGGHRHPVRVAVGGQGADPFQGNRTRRAAFAPSSLLAAALAPAADATAQDATAQTGGSAACFKVGQAGAGERGGSRGSSGRPTGRPRPRSMPLIIVSPSLFPLLRLVRNKEVLPGR